MKKNLLIILESFLNALDVRFVIEATKKYFTHTWEVGLGEIVKYLVKGRGYKSITPPQASHLLSEEGNDILIVDVREVARYEMDHIIGSVSKPIDDFVKEIYQGAYSDEITGNKVLIICDTGQLSRVAAALMAEEGFSKAYNIKGGMRRWKRWMKLSRNTACL